MKRIAPAWSLKDLYETDYRPNKKEKNDESVEPLTTYKQPVTKSELLLYIPYTRHTTTENASETITEETSISS